MRVLLTGGAGYIGSITARLLLERGHDVLTLDDLSTGHRDAVQGSFADIDLCYRQDIYRAFEAFEPDAVMHFAARALVGESMRDPRRYFHDNLVGAINLFDALLKYGKPPVVFSSTCATYGLPMKATISEYHQQVPVNPYGESKLCIERMLRAYDRAYGLRHATLRYFNAAGAAPEWSLGERHDPETHLIPILLQVAACKRAAALIFGKDYDTPDGTCIRDYVHVLDLADAHVRALDHLAAGKPSVEVNLGTGKGRSVMEVLSAARAVTGEPITAIVENRRPGDPPVLVADSQRAASVLGWRASRGLHEMVESAWRFMRERR